MQRVLITRPQPGATETAVRVAAMGLQPIVSPVLTIAQRTIDAPPGIAAIVVTSRNALASCPVSIRGRPVFAVGPATAALAAEFGYTNILNADGDAKALASLVAASLSPADGALLLPTAEGQGQELTALLRARGFRVVRRVAYRTLGASHLSESAIAALSQRGLSHAMFFSGETSRHFVHLIRAARLVEAVRDVIAVSISERAAVALRPLPWRRIRVAAKPNQDAMLVLLHD